MDNIYIVEDENLLPGHIFLVLRGGMRDVGGQVVAGPKPLPHCQ